MVRPERLELPAYWFEASRSIQLSYGRTRTDKPILPGNHDTGCLNGFGGTALNDRSLAVAAL